MPEEVWRDVDVREALAAWDFSRVSRLVRQRGALRQEDVAALTGLSQAFLSMLESGQRRLTNIDKITEFLAGLGAPAGLLRLPLPGNSAEPQDTTAKDDGDQDPALPWTVDRMVAALREAAGHRALDHGTLLSRRGIELTAYVHHWGTAEAEPLLRAQDGRPIPDSLLAHLQGTTDHLRLMDAAAGSGTLADLGSAHLELVLRILKQGTHTEAAGHRLAGIAADTATQTGWFAFDAGQHAHAQRYFLAALRAAHASGDVRLGAGALSYIAIHSYSTGYPRDAVVAAQAAREKIKTLHAPALEAMLLTRQARGHAVLGEGKAALRALGLAGELCAQGRSENDPHWLYWINEGEIHGQAGSCYLELGDPGQAIGSFTQAHDALTPSDLRTRALFLSRAATAQIRAGELEAGCATAHEAVALGEHLQSARLHEHLRTVIEELTPVSHTPYARDLLERTAVLTKMGN
ncbi:helix-turn-helix domain-containing protein [Streptomyces caatingaensis]|uniref:helix-turn-helix domain-containing protein n=1 Tax=Streptomyces caatingaensis TaxID=1678637 RepID=UPI000672791A|nr:helix-turn-helix domain-containing protein [Streptomyces caatingaensis]